MFSAVITVTAWLTLPVMTIPVTLQTFGVFLTLLLLGGRDGLISIIVYILLGLVGVPVFSGFKGGISTLFGPTGGYIIGFVFIAVIYLIFTRFGKEKLLIKIAALFIGLLVCYAFGTLWFVFVFNSGEEKIGFISALSMCVIPFVVPDVLKLAAAVLLSRAIEPALAKIGS